MNSTQNLKNILDSLHFTEKEQIAFKKATSVAREYMKDGSVDMEQKFLEIVEEVVKDEV